MRILHVNYFFDSSPEGREIIRRSYTTRRVCESLLERGHDVTVLQRFPQDEEFSINGVRYLCRADAIREQTPRPWHPCSRFHQIARDLKPDVVHVNSLLYPVQTLLLRRKLPKDVPLLVQNHAERPGPGLKLTFEKLFRASADGFIFCAEAQAETWKNKGCISQRQPIFEVIEGSTDLLPQDRDASRSALCMDGNPLVLWVGRLHPAKDPLLALAGLEIAAGKLPDLRLVMIYQVEDLLERVRAFIASSPMLAGRVTLIGKVPNEDLAPYYSAADLFVTSGPHEGSNYALIESIGCGCWPVCTDIPSHRVISGGGEFGSLFRVYSPEDCAQAIQEGFASRRSPSELRAHFERRLSFPVIARDLERVYTEMRSRGAGG